MITKYFFFALINAIKNVLQIEKREILNDNCNADNLDNDNHNEDNCDDNNYNEDNCNDSNDSNDHRRLQ